MRLVYNYKIKYLLKKFNNGSCLNLDKSRFCSCIQHFFAQKCHDIILTYETTLSINFFKSPPNYVILLLSNMQLEKDIPHPFTIAFFYTSLTETNT